MTFTPNTTPNRHMRRAALKRQYLDIGKRIPQSILPRHMRIKWAIALDSLGPDILDFAIYHRCYK